MSGVPCSLTTRGFDTKDLRRCCQAPHHRTKRAIANKDSIGPAIKDVFGGPFIANEGFDQASAEKALAEGKADAVAFGKLFISNPDLPRRFAERLPLNPWNTATFYSGGEQGYTDYQAF